MQLDDAPVRGDVVDLNVLLTRYRLFCIRMCGMGTLHASGDLALGKQVIGQLQNFSIRILGLRDLYEPRTIQLLRVSQPIKLFGDLSGAELNEVCWVLIYLEAAIVNVRMKRANLTLLAFFEINLRLQIVWNLLLGLKEFIRINCPTTH